MSPPVNPSSWTRPDTWLAAGLWAVSGATALLVALIFAFLVLEAWPALQGIGLVRFFTDGAWFPTEGLYDLAPMLAGSLLVSGGALVVATPLGIGTALFCNHFAPRPLAALVRRVVELLAGIPSVVYGLWGLVVLVPLISRLAPPGTSLLAGIAVLSIMILPTVALTADAAFLAVPREALQHAAALGLTRGGMLRAAVFPAARPALFAGTLLQTGRALGETMAVLMVCGNVVQLPKSLLEPVRTLTANIALEMAYALGDHRAALFVSGLVLLVLVVALVAVASLLEGRRDHG